MPRVGERRARSRRERDRRRPSRRSVRHERHLTVVSAPAWRRRLRPRGGSPAAPKPGDGAGRRTGEITEVVAPVLTRCRVREVQLDLHAVERRQRVGERERVVRERAGVEHDRRAAAAGAVDGVDELALVVRLQVLELVAVRRPRPRSRWRRARRAWWCRRSRARARRAGSGSGPRAGGSSPSASALPSPPHRLRRTRRRARARSGSSTRSSPIGPGSTKVSPPPDFLSRAHHASSVAARSGPPAHCVGQTERADERCGGGRPRRRRCAPARRRARREHEADRDRLAVQQLVAADRSRARGASVCPS